MRAPDSGYWINYLDRASTFGIYGRYSSRLLVGKRLLGWDLCEWSSAWWAGGAVAGQASAPAIAWVSCSGVRVLLSLPISLNC